MTRHMQPKKTVVKGLGWSGLYYDGSPGWCLSQFVEPKYPMPLSEDQREVLRQIPPKNWAVGDMYRVEITVRLVKNKKGKFITKRAKVKP